MGRQIQRLRLDREATLVESRRRRCKEKWGSRNKLYCKDEEALGNQIGSGFDGDVSVCIF